MESKKSPLTLDGRIRAEQNEVRVLRALHRFGWLTAKNLAALLWNPWVSCLVQTPRLEPAEVRASGLRMAQRTLARLVRSNQILRAPAPGGHVIYGLAEAGANRLVKIGAPASTAKDLIRRFSAAHFEHRNTANLVAIRAIVDGFKVSTEREIAQDKWLGGADGIAGKKPDVLIRMGKLVWWAEIEKSRKNANDYTKLLAWLDHVRADIHKQGGPELLDGGLRWAKVLFVNKPAFQAKLVKDLAARGWKQTEMDSLLVFDTKLLYSSDSTFFV
jgi:hypothetical protein